MEGGTRRKVITSGTSDDNDDDRVRSAGKIDPPERERERE